MAEKKEANNVKKSNLYKRAPVVEKKQTKIKGFFNKIKRKMHQQTAEDELAENIDKDKENIEIQQTAMAEKAKKAAEKATNTIAKLQINSDKTQAQMEALNEARKIINDRFLTVSEELGELRSDFLNTEKDIEGLEVKVAKSVDLVEAVQPQKLMEQVETLKMEMEKSSAKIETNKGFAITALDELKKIKAKMALFRGVEHILKLYREIDDKSIEIEKLKTITEKQADKVATIFIDTQKRFDKFKRFYSIAKGMKADADTMKSDVVEVKEKVKDFTTKKELINIKKELSETSELMMNTMNEMKEEIGEIHTKADSAHSKAHSAHQHINMLKNARHSTNHSNMDESRIAKIERDNKQIKENQKFIIESIKRMRKGLTLVIKSNKRK